VLQHLLNTLHHHWATTVVDPPTLYPGITLNTESLTAWYELWVTTFADRPRRKLHPEQIDVAITIHCFSTHPTDTTLAHQLAVTARQTLTHLTLAINDEADPPNSLGHLSIEEPTLHNLTRTHANQSRPRLQQLTLTFPAKALLTPVGQAF